MASNFAFGLAVMSYMNDILGLLTQTIILVSLYLIVSGLVRTHVKCKSLHHYSEWCVYFIHVAKMM